MDHLSICELFEQQTANTPGNAAISFNNQILTYSELNARANQLAHHLIQMGVKPETLVAVCLPRSTEFIIAILAILKAGGAYVPLDEHQPAERLRIILEDNKAPILITHSPQCEKFSDCGGARVFIDDQALWELPTHNPSIAIQPGNLAYVIYTSGTTGKPKGVLIEQRSVINYTNWFLEYTGSQPGERIDFSINPSFDMAVTTTIAGLMGGLHVVICTDDTKLEIRDYLAYLSESRINIIKITPTYLKVLLDEALNNSIKLPDLKTLILGGEMLGTLDCLRWLVIYPHHTLFNEYGPTEATVAVSQYKVTPDNMEKLGPVVPIGKPGPGMVCTLSENGELYIGGICLARGYLNQEKLTQEKFINTPSRFYKTGDLCHLLSGGDLEFVRRNDNQIKLRGFRIEPSEIEAALAMHPEIKAVVVIPREMQAGEIQLVAYCIPEDDDTVPEPAALRDYLRQKLAEYMIPSAFVMLDKFPLGGNHKLDIRALPQPEFSTQGTPAQTPLEKQVAAIWAEALNVNTVNLGDNFFELGGHSLVAARIIVKVENQLDKKINLQDLYHHPTVRDLVSVIKSAEKAPSASGHRHRDDVIPLSDFQFVFWISNLFEPKTKKFNVISRKRIVGDIDRDALFFACESVLKKHHILSYEIAKYSPVQKPRKATRFNILEKDLSLLSAEEREKLLFSSLNDLTSHFPWDKEAAFMLVRLFDLGNKTAEIQIAMPHIISDDHSREVLLADLSEFYLAYKKGHKAVPPDIAQYKDYVHYERNHMNKNLERDIAHWENYLKDAMFFPFPEELVVKNMKESGFPYSTSLELPENRIRDLKKICAKNHINVTYALCASLGLTLAKYFDYKNYEKRKIYYNVIKTLRENELYDRTIGCFLALDANKMEMDPDGTLIELSRRIQKSMIENVAFQDCSGMVKIACVSRNYLKRYKAVNFVSKMLANLYVKLFPSLKLDANMLRMYGRISFLGLQHHFMIDVNIWGNFISEPAQKNLFGCKQKETPLYQFDLIGIDNILDVSFMRDENNRPHLVISGNLKPEFREQLGREMIRHLSEGSIHPPAKKKDFQTLGSGVGSERLDSQKV